MLRRLSFILFYVKEVLAEGLDSVMTSLEGLDFGDVAELSPSAAVLLVEDVLVRVDYPDHFFFRLGVQILQAAWMENHRVRSLSERKRLLETASFIRVVVNAEQILDAELWLLQFQIV